MRIFPAVGGVEFLMVLDDASGVGSRDEGRDGGGFLGSSASRADRMVPRGGLGEDLLQMVLLWGDNESATGAEDAISGRGRGGL